MEIITNRIAEAYQPPPNVAPNNLLNKALFSLRLFLDLQFSTQYADVKKLLSKAKNKVLEVGCGSQPYRHLIKQQLEYYTIDWVGSHEHFKYKEKNVMYYDGKTFPFREGVFDFVFHTEVLEHVYDLKLFLEECYRVLSVTGAMFFTIPFAARYHYIPYDYWRMTPASIKKILESVNFKNTIILTRGNDIAVSMYKLNSVFFRIILRKIKNPILKVLNFIFFTVLFIIPIIILTIIGHLSILMKIGSPDDCLGYTVYCNKKE